MATQGTKRTGVGNDTSPDKRDLLIKSLPGENCPHCSEVCSAENRAIQCDLCGIWAHAECEGIPSECYDNFNSVFSKVHNISYYCEVNLCNSRVKQLIHNYYNDLEQRSHLPTLKSLQAEQGNLHRLVSEVSTKLDNLSSRNVVPIDESLEPTDRVLSTESSWHSDHQNLYNSISSLSEKINGLCVNNDQLQNQITTTVSSLNVANEQAQTVSHAPTNPAEIVDEYLNRERRKLNLVIYGLPEASATSAPDRQLADSNSFTELVGSEFKISNLEISKCVRLGKPKNDKPTPLLVTVADNAIRRQILRNAKHLRHSNTYKCVFISPDLTLQEREANKQLRQELRHRKDAGELNLIIKNGKIVSKQSTQREAPMETASTSN